MAVLDSALSLSLYIHSFSFCSLIFMLLYYYTFSHSLYLQNSDLKLFCCIIEEQKQIMKQDTSNLASGCHLELNFLEATHGKD